MSIIQVKTRSVCMTKPMTFTLFLPNDVPPMMTEGNPCYDRPTKTLVLLHGYTADSFEWLYYSTPDDLAVKYNLAVAVLDCDNAFYLDRPGTGNSMGRYIGEEIPRYLRQTFGLAKKREDTIIGGYSMGGFGALHTALAYPQTYGTAIALSSALIIHDIAGMSPDAPQEGVVADYAYYREVFGDLDKVTESENNPEVLVRKLLRSRKKMPRLLMACGTEDFLVESNRRFRRFLEDNNVPVDYMEAPGMHNFDFWNPGIYWALDKLFK
ncbi:MAG: alpha/beta fold hydrolase [Oscillospiraceae bacterium]|nr:alpha/beta fold hydrolase [Oscillospiraceae bacterium]